MIRVNDVYQCIQGEGSLTGVPMWLVRLQGCKVGCPWCDTKESWAEGGVETNELELVDRLRAENSKLKWFLITGGEPCLQNLWLLTDCLHSLHRAIALETSGTEPIQGEFDHITVSPKLGMPGGRVLLAESLGMADEIKMPVGKMSDIIALEQEVIPLCGKRVPLISLQPLSTSKAATDLCYQTCLERGWSLSLQTQKWIGAR